MFLKQNYGLTNCLLSNGLCPKEVHIRFVILRGMWKFFLIDDFKKFISAVNITDYFNLILIFLNVNEMYPNEKTKHGKMSNNDNLNAKLFILNHKIHLQRKLKLIYICTLF